MQNKILLLVICLTLSGISYSNVPKDDKKKSETEVSQLNLYKEGIVYALPRTGLIVKIKTQRTVFIPGPFYRYAKKYLGIENVKSSENTKWEILSLGLKNYTEADPNAIFKIEDSISFPVSVLPKGILSGINSKGVDYKNQIIGDDNIVNSFKHDAAFNDLSSDDFYYINVDAETGTETMELKTLEDKAREAADYIIRLRKKRSYTIIDPSDVIPEDGKGYEVFIKEAKRLDKEYMALFVGKTGTSKHESSFVFVPENKNVKNEILFRFSEEKGVLPKSDISGKPIMLEITKDQNAYNSSLKLKESLNPEAGKNGMFYRIPVNANIVVSEGLQTIYSGRTSIPQLGIIAPIPGHFLNGNYSIMFNCDSGTIKSIKEVE